MEIYLVRPGDNVAALARRWGLSVKEFTQLNQLSDPKRLTPGLSLVVPSAGPGHRPSLECCGALSTWARSSISQELLPGLSWLCCLSATVTAEGQLKSPDSVPLLEAAARHRAIPLLTVANLSSSGYSALLAHEVLCRPQAVSSLLDHILSALEKQSYQGVNLGFQYLFPFDREAYSNFVRQAAERLHAQGYYLFVSLAPKTVLLEEAPLCAAHDYKALGACADRLILLCHGWGSGCTAPQAIAPADRVQATLDYAVQKLPAGKLLLSISSQGCSWALPWRQGDEARPLSSPLAVNLAVSSGAEIRYDNTAQAPFFTYTDALGQRRIVWYEDGRSILSRLQMACGYGLAGVNLWCIDRLYRPGLELLRTGYSVEKFV